MSKGKGQKIAIKFDKPLLGDVSGNESAFTITGFQRNPLKAGELQTKQFTVDNVERYPITALYEDDFMGGVNSGIEVGENELKLEALSIGREIEDTKDGTTRFGSSYARQGNSVTFKQAGKLIKVKIKPGDTRTLTLKIYKNNVLPVVQEVSGISGVQNVWLTVELPESIDITANDIYTFDFVPASNSRAYYSSGLYNGTLWQNNGAVYSQAIGSSGWTGGTIAMGFIFAEPSEFIEIGERITSPINTTILPESPRIKYDISTPEGTSVTVEYATNNSDTTPPETWAEADDGDLLTISGDYLWLKYTLETEDTAVSPTLLSLWIEEAESPPDTILLSFDTYNRFNDVEGDITVAYSQGLGTLAGTRPVESFSVDFAPEDLEPTPIDEHTLTVGMDITVDLITLIRKGIHSEQHTLTAGMDVTVALIDVDDINP